MGLKDLGKNTATTYLEAAAVVEDTVEKWFRPCGLSFCGINEFKASFAQFTVHIS